MLHKQVRARRVLRTPFSLLSNSERMPSFRNLLHAGGSDPARHHFEIPPRIAASLFPKAKDLFGRTA